MSLRVIILFAFASLLYGKESFAGIFRINNALSTDKNQKIYKTIKEANDDATVAAGDTLMVEGSSTAYPDVTLTKKLVLIGPGYLLTANPQTQANSLQAIMGQITIKLTASGTILEGLTFSSDYFADVPTLESTDVIITRCYLPNPIVLNSSVSDLIITDNYFVSSPLSFGYFSYTATGLIFNNNFVGGQLDPGSTNQYQRIFSSVSNNIFSGNLSLSTSVFRSNIILSTATSANIASTNIQNNLVSGSQLPATNGNQVFTLANLFVGATGNSLDGQYKLKSDSPYKTAGYNNTEPGIFGGGTAYVLSGMPPVPSIYEFTADGIANKQAGLQVNIKVKANQ